MANVEIKFLKTHADAQLPKQNHTDEMIGDSGYDIFAVLDKTIPAKGSAIILTGIEVAYISPQY